MIFRQHSKTLEFALSKKTIISGHVKTYANQCTLSNGSIGKSRAGNSTKVHLAVNSGGLPIYFKLSEGQKHNITHTPNLVEHLKQVEIVIADKGYDSDAFANLS